MRIYVMPRRSGKTEKLINESSLTGYPILCANNTCAELIKKRAKELKLEIPTPISASNLSRTRDGYRPKSVLIDEAPWVMSEIIRNTLGCGIESMTINDVGTLILDRKQRGGKQMKYKVGDKTVLGEIADINDYDGRYLYYICVMFDGNWFTESEIDAIIIKPKRNIDKIAELWSDGKREDAKELYEHIQFIEGSYSGTMINGLLAPYTGPSLYPKLTPEELKAVKWLVDGGYATVVRETNHAYACYGKLRETVKVSSQINPISKCLDNASWITESPINLAELLAAQEGV